MTGQQSVRVSRTVCTRLPQLTPAVLARLMEVGVWSLARWADTYLFPEDNLPQALHAAYASRGGPALAVLERVAAVANTCLVAFAGEAELHRQVRQ